MLGPYGRLQESAKMVVEKTGPREVKTKLAYTPCKGFWPMVAIQVKYPPSHSSWWLRYRGEAKSLAKNQSVMISTSKSFRKKETARFITLWPAVSLEMLEEIERLAAVNRVSKS